MAHASAGGVRARALPGGGYAFEVDNQARCCRRIGTSRCVSHRYMTAADFMRAADDLAPRVLLPFHWEFWRNHTGDLAELFAEYYREAHDFAMKLLLVGDSLSLVP